MIVWHPLAPLTIRPAQHRRRPCACRPGAAPPILGLGPTARAASEFHAGAIATKWRAAHADWTSAGGQNHPYPAGGARPAMPPITCACCCSKTPCCSAATTSSTAAPPWSTRPTATYDRLPGLLDALDALCATRGRFILPAHGYVLGFACQAIAQLRRTRLAREARSSPPCRPAGRQRRGTGGACLRRRAVAHLACGPASADRACGTHPRSGPRE